MEQLYREKRLVEAYDALNASREDFDFYRARLPDPPCRILDIGCGTGSLALDLASEGYAVTGVDPAPEMIAAARAKPGADKVKWVTGLVSDLDEALRFEAAIMTGHAFQCLLDDEQVLALFRGISSRLTREGSFWFETRNPLAKAWERWIPENVKPPTKLGGRHQVHVAREIEAFEDDTLTLLETYSFDDGDEVLVSRSRLRFMPLISIERLAATADLRICTVAGDWNGGPLNEESPEVIVQLMKCE